MHLYLEYRIQILHYFRKFPCIRKSSRKRNLKSTLNSQMPTSIYITTFLLSKGKINIMIKPNATPFRIQNRDTSLILKCPRINPVSILLYSFLGHNPNDRNHNNSFFACFYFFYSTKDTFNSNQDNQKPEFMKGNKKHQNKSTQNKTYLNAMK